MNLLGTCNGIYHPTRMRTTPCVPLTTNILFAIRLSSSKSIKLTIATTVCTRVKKSDTASTGKPAARAVTNTVTNEIKATIIIAHLVDFTTPGAGQIYTTFPLGNGRGVACAKSHKFSGE